MKYIVCTSVLMMMIFCDPPPLCGMEKRGEQIDNWIFLNIETLNLLQYQDVVLFSLSIHLCLSDDIVCRYKTAATECPSPHFLCVSWAGSLHTSAADNINCNDTSLGDETRDEWVGKGGQGEYQGLDTWPAVKGASVLKHFVFVEEFQINFVSRVDKYLSQNWILRMCQRFK